MGSKTMGINTMRSQGMKSARLHTKGFTLIASLLLLLLLSGIAIGLLMMVNTEGKVGGTDLQNDVAYHSAEGGIEKMASDLAATFQNSQAPTAAQICAVSNMQPAMAGVTWMDYSVAPVSGCLQEPPSRNWGQISSGPDQGLWAQIIPVNMMATAAQLGGQEVSMLRSAQVALIPVFQFGVFCEGDCAFFSNPTLDFAGRVHANGDLYLGVAGGNTITFHQKLEAYGNIVRQNIPNGLAASASNDDGTVYIPYVNGDCPTPGSAVANNCVVMQPTDGSVTGMGGNPPASAYNTVPWYAFSKGTANYETINGNYGNPNTGPPSQVGTGAKKLSMPFVGGNAQPYEIIRRPQAGEDPTSALATSREYNMAQIRVLLSDDPQDFVGSTSSTNPGNQDANNIRLANVTAAQATATGTLAPYPNGVKMIAGNYTPTLPAPAPNTYNLYFATASNAVPSVACATSASCAAATTVADWTHAPWTWNAAMEATAAPGSPYPLLQPTGNPWVLGDNTTAPQPLTLCPPANAAALPAGCPAAPASPYYVVNGTTVYNGTANGSAANLPLTQATASWNLIDGWLRVEYKDANGNWNPVTKEWLELGFARDTTAPTANGAGLPAGGIVNPINPNAILLLQEPVDRATTGVGTTAATLTLNGTVGTAPSCTAFNGSGQCTAWKANPPQALPDTLGSNLWQFGLTPAAPPVTQSITQYNWYPINFYDAREGEARDVIHNNNSCTTNGVMNAVEIDVGNLKRWLAGQIGKNPTTGLSSGPNVDFLAQNGYVLYFSDRRGMLYSQNPPFAGTKTGDSGLEDVVNAASQAGVPDGVLEAPGGNKSPEDVNLNGFLDKFGTANMGLGQYNGAANLNPTPGTPYNPYNTRITSCSTTGRKNWVSGARHVLKLVDGSLGNVPLRTDAKATLASPGGFTVASENPVYIQGDYNSNAADTFFTNPTTTAPANDILGHSAASVIADAVTILSNSWDDRTSMGMGNIDVTDATTRPATTTYYRLAVAGGKNKAFPFPAWANANPDYPFGTDGGVGNFLRFLEDWSGGVSLNYGGSLVSLYYSTYGTGIFKCCEYAVYAPPNRNYVFDVDFTLPGGVGLPPGTPLFRDVETLGYRQMFTTRDSSSNQ
jgi:Tfp pilus assembly protein PilX